MMQNLLAHRICFPAPLKCVLERMGFISSASCERISLFDIIDAMSDIFPRDISYMIKSISATETNQTPAPTQTMMVDNEVCVAIDCNT